MLKHSALLNTLEAAKTINGHISGIILCTKSAKLVSFVGIRCQRARVVASIACATLLQNNHESTTVYAQIGLGELVYVSVVSDFVIVLLLDADTECKVQGLARLKLSGEWLRKYLASIFSTKLPN